MSGVAGADRIKSRQDFQQFIASYKELVSKFPGFVSIQPSGSYNSDANKNDFGDIDLITHIKSTKNKKEVKLELVHFFEKQPDTTIVAFTSDKHAGKRSYNSGEIVTVRYHDDVLGYSAQIDNIIALDHIEAGFKQQFLDMPAEKQGLVLGLVKIATVETPPKQLFAKLNIRTPVNLEPNQEFEFNLSSTELQLRKVTYKPGTFEQLSREIIWRSQNYGDLQKLLYQYDLSQGFDELLKASQATIQNPRSKNRMQGVFGSMITVKSGEVGTAKGANKVAALDKIKNTFAESVFNALVEAHGSTMVFAFGRFQPPTIGHELLVNTVTKTATAHKASYAIFVSRTQDKKKNPLPLGSKLHYLKEAFPGVHFVGANDEIRTFMEAAKSFNGKFKNLIMVAGGDRVAVFEETLNKYNHIEYNFDSIQVVSAGDRDPDADEASGASGTKMREYAANNDLKSFIAQLPRTVGEHTAQQMMNEIRLGMGIKQEQPMSESRLQELIAETKRMSAAVKLQKAYQREQEKSAASRERGNNILNPKKASEKPKAVGAGSGDVKMSEATLGQVSVGRHGKIQRHREPTWSFKEIAEKLGIPTNVLNNIAFRLTKDFPEPIPGLKASHGTGGSSKYYPQSAVKRWFHANNIKELVTNFKTQGPNPKAKDSRKDLYKTNDFMATRYTEEDMLPKSSFAGSDKNKLGRAGQLMGKDKRPAKAGDLVGSSESTMREFAPSHDNGGSEDDTLLKYARMWYNGDLPVQQKVERVLDRMGWEIGELESEEGGCFVVRSGDEHGKSYVGFSPEDLSESVEEEKQRLDPKCWKGYRKAGTKMKGGKRVNNCVPIGETAENILGRLIRILESK